MATYAAVVSLMNTMDAVMNDPRISTCFNKQQIQSLGEKLDVLLRFIENYNCINSLGCDEEARSLERRITSAAHAAEDVIESHIVAQIHAGVLQNAPTSCIDLLQIMHAIDEIKEEVVQVEVKMGSNDEKPKRSPPPLPAGKITMIGFDDYLDQLLEGLIGSESGRLVIPIVGMGGVGKTTLTKNAYEHLLIVHHFDVRVWVSISQQYDVNNILVQLLSAVEQTTQGKNEGGLRERLYKSLYGRRYLVVLDDVWSITAWEKLMFSFPDQETNSRIIVTTRQLEVANYFGSSRVVRMGLLDVDKSWDLFCNKAFAQQGCPDELEKIGKAIVKKCKGLPLSIVVIGALLGKSSQTEKYWKNIADNMSSILSSILVDSFGWNKKFKSFHIHDLVRDMCLREAQQEKFYLVIKTLDESKGKDMERRLVIHKGCGYIHTSTVVRSVICEWNFHLQQFSESTLLRVLDEGYLPANFNNIASYLEKVNMRFFSNDTMSSLDRFLRSIFLLWNLQTLIFRYAEYELEVPVEIWEMRQLRHIKFHSITLPEPPLSDEGDEFVVLHYLQTLTKVVDLKFSEDVCKRIPNIRRLKVSCNGFSKNSNGYCFHNIGRLIKLESLSFNFWKESDRSHLVQNLTLPTSLKKLSLMYSGLHCDDMRIIGSLPNLEVLKLLNGSFVGTEWTCVEGEFLALKHLQIHYCNCGTWNAESSHFPVLDTLILEGVALKDGTPSGIGDIPTLRIVRVDRCSNTIMISAMKMLEEQEDLENDAFQLQLQFDHEEQVREFLEEVEKERITCKNFNCTTY